MQAQQAPIRNLENQLRQLASALNNRPPERLLSDTQTPRMEENKECKTIELRSGKELPDPNKNQKPNTNNKEGSPYMEEDNKDGWIEVQKPVPQLEPVRYVPKLPCPQRQLKHKMNQKLQVSQQFQKVDKQHPICQGIRTNVKLCKVYIIDLVQKKEAGRI